MSSAQTGRFYHQEWLVHKKRFPTNPSLLLHMKLQNIQNEGIEVALLPSLYYNTVRDGAVVQYTIVEVFPK